MEEIMPFDGYNMTESVALEKIDLVLELLATEARWCKGALQRPDGRLCLVGAMQAAEAYPLLEPVVLRAISEVTHRSYCRIESFNDRRTTTHAEVIRVLHHASAQIRSGAVSAGPASAYPLPPATPLAGWLAPIAACGANLAAAARDLAGACRRPDRRMSDGMSM